MSDMKTIIQQPIFFERNRVGRVYTGGKLFGDFFGDDGTDGFLPEEWIASSVRAINKISAGPKEGVSRIRGTDIYFDELLAAHADEVLGAGNRFNVLVKMLDSAIRLPVQAHPDSAYSAKYLNSTFGKAESWIVTGVRENAKIYLGFSRKVSMDEFKQAIELSKFKADAFSHFMNSTTVSPGDCFFIPANTIHAIGPGCLILEVQEPTDFTISPEYWCGDYEQNASEMYLGLAEDVALSVFDFSRFGADVLESNRLKPRITEKTEYVTKEVIVDRRITPCFSVNRIAVRGGRSALSSAPGVYVVTSGEGAITGSGYEMPVKKGDYFFLPAEANGRFSITAQDIEVYECFQ